MQDVGKFVSAVTKKGKSKYRNQGFILLSHLKKHNHVLYCVVLRGVEWVHGLFLFPLVLGKM